MSSNQLAEAETRKKPPPANTLLSFLKSSVSEAKSIKPVSKPKPTPNELAASVNATPISNKKRAQGDDATDLVATQRSTKRRMVHHNNEEDKSLPHTTPNRTGTPNSRTILHYFTPKPAVLH